MKKLKILLGVLFLLISFNIFSQEESKIEVLTIDGEEYNVVIPEDYSNLKKAYIRSMTAYLKTKNNYETLKSTFDEYQEETDILIASKNEVIAEQKELIIIKDARIKQLESVKERFSIIPSVYYSISENGSSGGAGVGFLLFNSLFLQAQGGYPLEARFSIGWKF
jgi:hypothetical protein